MPPITALLHTRNDAFRLGRALETLRPCDEILVVDHGSHDATLRIAREYGARLIAARDDSTPPGHYLQLARHSWVLCLEPRESLTESLEASLFEWESESSGRSAPAFSAFLREETAAGWLEHPTPHTRLVPQLWDRWEGSLPAHEPSSMVLEGELLRFILP